MKSKIKKLLLLTFTLLLVFGTTSCDKERPPKSKSDDLNFVVDGPYMVELTRNLVSDYREVSEAEERLYLNDGTDFEKSAVEGFAAAQSTDNVGEYLGFASGEDSVNITNGADGKVNCSVLCRYANRDVKVTISYEENYEYDYTKEKYLDQIVSTADSYGVDLATYVEYAYGVGEDQIDQVLDGDLKNYGIYKYKPVECEVSAVYSKGELIAKAGKNTAIGMGVVFCVLIFISFVISLLKFLPMLFDAEIRKQKAEEKAAAEKAAKKTEEAIIKSKTEEKAAKEEKPEQNAPKEKKAEKPAAKKSDDLMDDAELVAVITAAIYAAQGTGVKGPAYTASNDKLVVRSIRRVR